MKYMYIVRVVREREREKKTYKRDKKKTLINYNRELVLIVSSASRWSSLVGLYLSFDNHFKSELNSALIVHA